MRDEILAASDPQYLRRQVAVKLEIYNVRREGLRGAEQVM